MRTSCSGSAKSGDMRDADEQGLSSDEEEDAEIQQLIGNLSPRSALKLQPRRQINNDDLELIQHFNEQGQQVFIEEGSGFVTPIPWTHSTSSLLGEAFLSSYHTPERACCEEFQLPMIDHGGPQCDLDDYSHDGTTTPPSDLSSSLHWQLSPPPLSPKTRPNQGDYQQGLIAVNKVPKNKLPPRQPSKDRLDMAGFHSRANSEASLLSALTMDSAHPQGLHEYPLLEQRRIAVDLSACLQQPILNDDEGQDSASCGVSSAPLRPSYHRQKSSRSIASSTCKRPLPHHVFLPECGSWEKASESTVVHTLVSRSLTMKGIASINKPASQSCKDSSI